MEVEVEMTDDASSEQDDEEAVFLSSLVLPGTVLQKRRYCWLFVSVSMQKVVITV